MSEYRPGLKQITYPASESSKWRHLTLPFCQSIGLDIGASGDPVTPSAISCDLPQPYCPPLGPHAVQMPVDARHVHHYFRVLSMDFVYSSHLLEDFDNWQSIVLNWMDLVKPGGYLVLLVPERDLWKRALDRGQPPNMAHKHEFKIGELSGLLQTEVSIKGDWELITEEIPDPNDYSLLFVARRNHITGAI